jgi:superfamily II DNA or RNA helicase
VDVLVILPSLYDYQAEGIDKLNALFAANADAKGRDRSVVLVLPTAGGKTQMAVYAAIQQMQRGGRALFLTEAVSLVTQSSDRFARYDVPTGIICATATATNPAPKAPMQVGGILTLANRPKPRNIKLVIIDECHECGFSLKQRWWADVDAEGNWIHWDSDAWVIGLTATPWRTKRSEWLGQLWKHVVVVKQPHELMRRFEASGYTEGIAPPIYYGFETAIDLSEVRSQMGDWRAQDLEIATTTPTAIKAYLQAWEDRCFRGTLKESMRTLIFCAGLPAAGVMAEAFNQRWADRASQEGFPDLQLWHKLEGLDNDEERRRWFDRVKNYDSIGLTSADLLTTGIDIPEIEAVFPRPTKSKVVNDQQIGRAARPCISIGKRQFIVVDPALNCLKMGMLDQPQDYSIEAKKAAESVDEAVRQCPVCQMVSRVLLPVCPGCGYVWPIKKKSLNELTGTTRRILSKADRQFQREYRKQARISFEAGFPPSHALVTVQLKLKSEINAADICEGDLLLAWSSWLISGAKPKEPRPIISAESVTVGDGVTEVETADGAVYRIPHCYRVPRLPIPDDAALAGAMAWRADRRDLRPATAGERTKYWEYLVGYAKAKGRSREWCEKWFGVEFGGFTEESRRAAQWAIETPNYLTRPYTARVSENELCPYSCLKVGGSIH